MTIVNMIRHIFALKAHAMNVQYSIPPLHVNRENIMMIMMMMMMVMMMMIMMMRTMMVMMLLLMIMLMIMMIMLWTLDLRVSDF